MLTINLWLLVTAVLLVIFSLFALIFLRSTKNELEHLGRVFAEHYADNMDRDIRQLSDTVDELYVNNVFYQRLINYTLDDYDWVDNTWHIQNSLREKSAAMDFLGGLFYYDAGYDSMRSCFSQDYSEVFLTDRFRDWIRENSGNTQGQSIFSHNGKDWLVSYKSRRGKFLGYLICLQDYVQSDDTEEVIFLGKDGNILSRTGNLPVTEAELGKLIGGGSAVSKGSLLLSAAPIRVSSMTLVSVMRANTFRSLFAMPQFVLLMVLLPVLALLALLYFYRFHNRALSIPVEHILLKISEMKKDQRDEDLIEAEKEADAIEEYREINERVDGLLQEIESLSEARHREEMNAKSALLQYYQLQIDPHFYLNCLNSISSLLENQTPEIANDMIYALSSHFRYVFQSNRTMVTLSEELRELRNYCNIYQVKGGVPILLSVDVPDEVVDWKIPILAIQTFVENSIKHVTKKGKVLTVKVHAHRSPEASGLLLKIVDNGPGYPPDLLEFLNTPVTDFNFDSEHVGILNLKYRCRLLYEGKERFSFYNAPQGGAAAEILIPEEGGSS